MPLEAAAAPVAEAPAPEAPAAPITFEAAKAARREAPPAELPDTASANSKPPAPVVPIEMDAEALKAATALSKEARETRAKLKEAEAKAAEASKLLEAKKLIAEGKHLAAIEALGVDLNAAVAEQLGTAPPEPAGDLKMLELEKTVEQLKAEEAERKKRDEEAAKASAAAAREADVKAVADFVQSEKGKFPFLSRRTEWVQGAYESAEKAYPGLVEKAGRALNPEEKHRLIVAALEEAEEEHRKTAQIYGAPVTLDQRGRATPQKASARPNTFDSSMRGGTAAPATKAKTKVTFEEAKRQRRG